MAQILLGKEVTASLLSLIHIYLFWCGSDIDRISYGNEPWYRSYDSDVLCAGRTDSSGMV